MKLALLFTFSITLVACTTRFSDVSEHRYFKGIIGQQVALLRPMKLCERRDNRNYRAMRTIGLIEVSEHCDLKELALLPAGEIVSISGVKEMWVPTLGPSWYALGSVQLPEVSYEFEYLYSVFDIRRAPWEDKSVPPKRTWPNET